MLVANTLFAAALWLAQATGPPATTADLFKRFQIEGVLHSGTHPAMPVVVARDTGKVRVEFESNKNAVGVIVRYDTRKAYFIDHSTRSYLEQDYNPSTTQYLSGLWNEEVNPQAAGTEIVDNQRSTLYIIPRKKGEARLWISQQTGAPVRFANDFPRATVDISSYSAAPIDPSVFEPPANYRAAKLPFGLSAPLGGNSPTTPQ